METELKFRVVGRVKPGALERLDWAPYALEERQVHRLRDVLLDTPDRTITGRMHALRVRRDGPVTYVTLKGQGNGVDGARHTREEWQEVIPDTAVGDPLRWPEPIRARVVELAGQQALEPIMEVRNKRHTWEVRRDGRLVAELALDAGEIQAGTRTAKLHEIEVELKGEGTEEDLTQLEQRLKQSLPLTDESRTKLERGLDLLQRDGEVEEASDTKRGGEMAMGPAAPLAEAGRAILRKHWEKLRASEPGVRAGEDPEAVHDMRVATRRMRAVLEVLGETIYDQDVTAALRKGLKRLAAALGVVRDAEVWMQAVDAYAARLTEDERAGLEPLLAELRARREAGRAELFGQLDGKRTARLFSEIKRFVSTEGAGVRTAAVGPGGAPLRVRDAAGSALWSRLEEVHAFDAIMPEAPLLILHELRIACKHLRYTLELFDEALGPTGRLMRNDLVAAQDHLGSLHDADVAIPFVDELLADDPHNLALQHYRAHLQSERDRLWAGTGEVWATIGGPDFRTRLATTIAAL